MLFKNFKVAQEILSEIMYLGLKDARYSVEYPLRWGEVKSLFYEVLLPDFSGAMEEVL